MDHNNAELKYYINGVHSTISHSKWHTILLIAIAINQSQTALEEAKWNIKVLFKVSFYSTNTYYVICYA